MMNERSQQLDFQIIDATHKALREEILLKLKHSHQLGSFKLLSIGGILGLVVSGGAPQEFEAVLFMGLAALPVAFDAMMYLNGSAIIQVGSYLRDEVEPKLKLLHSQGENLVLWEEFIAKRMRRKRFYWNLFEVVHYGLTLSLLLLAGWLLVNEMLWTPVALNVLAIIIEAILIAAALRRR